MKKVKSVNPLVEAMKTKNAFVRIPSNGVLEYKKNVFDGTTGDEIGISGRTSKDELMFQSPDALMNGKAVSSCIENCVEQVISADGLYLPDVYTLLLGIKLASGEKSYDIEAVCPKCSKKGAFTREITPLIENAELLYDLQTITFDNGLILTITPNTWGFYNKINEKLFQKQYILKVVKEGLESKQLEEKDAAEQIDIVFKELIELQNDLAGNCIKSVELPDGRVITDEKHIREFIDCFSTEQMKQLKEKMSYLNNGIGIDNVFPVQCSDCKHEWDINQLEYDPSNFFGQSFSVPPSKK